MKKRAVRRHHYQRLKNHRKKKWNSWGWNIPDHLTGAYVTTACKCSCYMCGNPRRYAKAITRQEYQLNLKYIEGCFESDIYCSLTIKSNGKLQK